MTFDRKGLAELENAVDGGKSLDVRLEFNGDFEDSVAVYLEEESA